VFVGCIDEHCFTTGPTAHYKHVVIKGPDHHFVHLYIGVMPVQSGHVAKSGTG
jgi:predicted class III extradiol MEMO1 family dioxygenase